MRALLLAAILACVGCTSAIDGMTRAVNASGDTLTTSEAALAASERAAVKTTIDLAKDQTSAEQSIQRLTLAYGKAWEAYSLARQAQIFAIAAVKAGTLDSNSTPSEAIAAVAQLATAEAAFVAAVKGIKQ